MDSKEERRLLHLFDIVAFVEPESGSSSVSDFFDRDADPEYEPSSEDSHSENEISENEELKIEQVPASENVAISDKWQIPDQKRVKNINYNTNSEEVGINADLIETMQDASPFDLFSLFCDEEVESLLVNQTNIYAQQCIQSPNIKRSARIKSWVPTNRQEMHTFLGILMWMGLVDMSSLAHYWKNTQLYNSKLTKYMARSRFELILSMFHISDNSAQVPGNRLHKVQPLIDLLVDKFNHFIIPEMSLCIDESMVPFQGRLSFRQYLQNKRHRYGVKIFKLCTDPFYTLQYKVYAGKEAQRGTSVSSKVVMELMEPYLDFGITLYADNWYNSVTLTE